MKEKLDDAIEDLKKFENDAVKFNLALVTWVHYYKNLSTLALLLVEVIHVLHGSDSCGKMHGSKCHYITTM